jgi:hypothetical protein
MSTRSCSTGIVARLTASNAASTPCSILSGTSMAKVPKSGCGRARSRARRLLATLEAWLREQRARLANSSSVAKPIDYMLRRWDRFARFIEDGRICLTNNAAERALRGLPWDGSPGSSPAPNVAPSAPRSWPR